MKIQLINKSKLKIIFDLNDLRENNISLHSFLSGSENSKNFFKALLEIAEEDFDIDFTHKDILYQIFCFKFSEFVITITIIDKASDSLNTYTIHENYTDSLPTSDQFSFKFIGNELLNYTNSIYYIFNTFESFLDFSNYSKTFLKLFKIDSILYKYKNVFFLEIKSENLSIKDLKKVISIFSEIKNALFFSELFTTHIKEFSKIIISTNALNI